MVLMKNSANAAAPAALCSVARNGITGGFSPAFMFGPDVGTSAGTRGWTGVMDDDGSAPEAEADEPGVDN